MSTKHTSRSIEKYLQSSGRKTRPPKSFANIMRFFIAQFIINDPDKAIVFSSNSAAKSAYNFLGISAILFEKYFPQLEFEKYLQLCVSNDLEPKEISALSKSYNPLLVSGKRQNKKNIYYRNLINKKGNQIVQFYLWQPKKQYWSQKTIALSEFSNLEQKKMLRSQNIPQKTLIEKVVIKSGAFLFYVGHHSNQAIFEFLTHALCYALLTYKFGKTAESRLESLLNAHNYLSEVFFVNIAQSNRGKELRADSLQTIITDELKTAPFIARSELIDKIASYKSEGVIDDIDEEDIFFSNKGKSDSAPISGIKDRLYRAKKKLTNSPMVNNKSESV